MNIMQYELIKKRLQLRKQLLITQDKEVRDHINGLINHINKKLERY